MTPSRWIFGAALAAMGLSALPVDVAAIPAFARRYHVSCSLCHAPPPRLNAFGERFAANGFQLARRAAPPDTLSTGDQLLQLMEQFPLAVRMDAAAQWQSEVDPGMARTDLQTPWVIKLLSGGQVARNVSYYMYFLLTERGEVGGLEDAYVQFTDLGAPGLDLIAGQFQASDPMFKRELRLELDDYMPYRVRVGESTVDLTYERGVTALYSPWEGGDLAIELTNGQGLSAASSLRQYDVDNSKNVLGRLSQSLGPARIGAFGFYGRQHSGPESDRITMWGPDFSLELPRSAQLNAQFVHREDDNPFFGANEPVVKTNAAFAELVWPPRGPTGRLFLFGLYNWIDADHPAVSLNLGEAVPFSRYQSGTLGASWLLWRNLRLQTEGTWDVERERGRAAVGFMAAF